MVLLEWGWRPVENVKSLFDDSMQRGNHYGPVPLLKQTAGFMQPLF
jgi:hypothetical protein